MISLCKQPIRYIAAIIATPGHIKAMISLTVNICSCLAKYFTRAVVIDPHMAAEVISIQTSGGGNN